VFKRLGIVIVILYLSACGLEVNSDKKSEQETSDLTETNMTGIWLSEQTTTFTSKSDGQVLDTSIVKNQTYIEDTANGIEYVTCDDMRNDFLSEQPYNYIGTKTNDKYFPLGESNTSELYTLEDGELAQESTVDAMYGDQNATMSVRKTLTFVESKDSIYSDGTISLSGAFEFSATTDICTQKVKQTQTGNNETNGYTFFVPFNDEQDWLEIVFLFAGTPPPGLYNLDTSEEGSGFISAYTWSHAPSYEELDIHPYQFGEPGRIDLISADQNSFEGNFSVTIENHGELTGYISVDVSGLQ